MEGRVKSHISNKTYTTDLEILEEEDVDETSELYMIPISGHKIMVAPGKSIMDDGIAYCYVYVIKEDKVLCKLGIYEKKTETMPLFFDISTFPEGSFCLFEEYEKNPSKLVDFEIVDVDVELEAAAVVKTADLDLRNVFDVLIEEFEKIPNKRERIKSAYKSLFSTYETKKSIEKYKKMKPILKTISDAGKEEEPTDAFIRTLKTNAQDKPVFVMTLLALERIFFIDFTFVTEMADERDEYIKMKEDWPVSNATKDLEIDVNTYAVLDPNFIPKNANDVQEAEPEPEPESEESEEAEAEPETEPEAEPVEEEESEVQAEPEDEPLPEMIESNLSKTNPKSRPSTIPENKSLSMNKPETVKSKKSTKIPETSESLSKKKTTPKIPETSESLSKKTESVKSKKNTTPTPTEKVSSKPKPTQAEDPESKKLYESPLSESTIQSILSRPKSHKSTAKLITDYKSGIQPSTPEDEKRLRSALVEMARASLMKGKKRTETASVIATDVSKVKASKPETATEPNVTLKQTRSIPAVKTKSKPDKVV